MPRTVPMMPIVRDGTLFYRISPPRDVSERRALRASRGRLVRLLTKHPEIAKRWAEGQRGMLKPKPKVTAEPAPVPSVPTAVVRIEVQAVAPVPPPKPLPVIKSSEAVCECEHTAKDHVADGCAARLPEHMVCPCRISKGEVLRRAAEALAAAQERVDDVMEDLHVRLTRDA